MIRKVRYPLKLKLIFLLSILLCASVAFYVQYAVSLFKEDKSAYIYDTALSHTNSLAKRIQTQLQANQSLLQLMGDRLMNDPKDPFLKKLFLSNDGLLAFQAFDNKQKLFQALYRDDLTIEQQKGFEAPIFDAIREHQFFLEPRVDGTNLPHLLLGVFHKEANTFLIGRFEALQLEAFFTESKAYTSLLLTFNGENLLKSNDENFYNKNPDSFKNILSSKIAAGVKTIEIEDKKFLIAFERLSKEGIIILSSISQEEAFKITFYLIRQSLYFGLLTLSIAIVLGILFSRSLTSPLSKLFATTQKIAEGDFQTRTNLNSKDEIGALSDSINFMSDEIVRYMEEMKEKLRLENEIQVAQLVQSSFFPADDLQMNGLQLAAHYKPASECGGDWWGVLDFSSKQVVIIADATGHGVPAALLTATAHSAASLIEHMAKNDPKLLDHPSKILSLMNKAVCDAGTKVLMTCFVAIIDQENKSITYANASHNPPLLLKAEERPWDRKSFHPLMQANGPRLGHETEGIYADENVSYNEGDTIIFYTDGIVENENPDGKQWGQRNFLKASAEALSDDIANGRDLLKQKAYDFYAGRALDDDITIVLAKLG